jgi:dTDP-4-amino-4,6-dideoxygalactose transaminase
MKRRATLEDIELADRSGEDQINAADIIPFNRVYLTGKEQDYFLDVLKAKELACNGRYTHKVQDWLKNRLGTKGAFLTGAGTLALEMAALLLDLEPGDEVIMPSFTFVTTASAFARAGATPVFVDIKADTMNIDVAQVEKAISNKTKAIVPVHYAGVGCNMDALQKLAKKHSLAIVEDAAHGILATYKDRYLGTIGDIGVLSFHETKNVVGGEAGALLINNEKYLTKARQLWHKGTNKHDMELGLVGKYTWTELGSAFAASEITASVVWAQIEKAAEIVEMRKAAWQRYYELLVPLAKTGSISLPHVPNDCVQNGHIFYFLTQSKEVREALIKHLKEDKIESVFHYIPLHSSPAGLKYGKCRGDLSTTDSASERLLRLPLWADLNESLQKRIVASIEKFYQAKV